MQPLDVARAHLHPILHLVYRRGQALQLVVQLLHLLHLRVELRVRGRDGEPRSWVCLPQARELQPRVEDLAGEVGRFGCECLGFVVICCTVSEGVNA